MYNQRTIRKDYVDLVLHTEGSTRVPILQVPRGPHEGSWNVVWILKVAHVAMEHCFSKYFIKDARTLSSHFWWPSDRANITDWWINASFAYSTEDWTNEDIFSLTFGEATPPSDCDYLQPFLYSTTLTSTSAFMRLSGSTLFFCFC